MTINLNPDERLDDLQRNGYKLIQNTKIFCFGMDAVLLCAFASVGRGDTVLDLGTGNGVIPILLKGRTEGSHFTGLEIQDINVDMAKRSVAYNGIEEYVDIVRGDIKMASAIFGGASFDVVTTNPPYMNENHGLQNPESAKAIARHEILCTLEDVIREGARVLKPQGRFCMVHRPHRLTEIFELMRKYHVEPKRMRMVHSFIDKEATMVLIEGVRGGKPMLKTERPLIIYKEPGKYTEEIIRLYED
ncbi:MAG: tRNA1(Val) (adenine(37)-N6)-methyltransferase [Butyrivibrio sp.]